MLICTIEMCIEHPRVVQTSPTTREASQVTSYDSVYVYVMFYMFVYPVDVYIWLLKQTKAFI